MAKPKKTRKRKPQRPPLSGLDKFLYGVIVLIFIALTLVSVFFFGEVLPLSIAKADESVIAINNSAAIMCSLPLGIFLLTAGIVIYSLGTTDRQPLFGNKKFKSKNDIPIADADPLFSADYWKHMRKSRRSLIKSFAVFFSIIFIICLAFIPFGVCARHTLDSTNHIKEYNSFNSLKESYKFDEAEKLVINITKSRQGRHSFRFSYGVQIKFIFADNDYVFGTANFPDLDRKETLEYMLYIKSLFKDRYEITNSDRFNALLSDQKYTAEEEALVYQLYDIKE